MNIISRRSERDLRQRAFPQSTPQKKGVIVDKVKNGVSVTAMAVLAALGVSDTALKKSDSFKTDDLQHTAAISSSDHSASISREVTGVAFGKKVAENRPDTFKQRLDKKLTTSTQLSDVKPLPIPIKLTEETVNTDILSTLTFTPPSTQEISIVNPNAPLTIESTPSVSALQRSHSEQPPHFSPQPVVTPKNPHAHKKDDHGTPISLELDYNTNEDIAHTVFTLEPYHFNNNVGLTVGFGLPGIPVGGIPPEIHSNFSLGVGVEARVAITRVITLNAELGLEGKPNPKDPIEGLLKVAPKILIKDKVSMGPHIALHRGNHWTLSTGIGVTGFF